MCGVPVLFFPEREQDVYHRKQVKVAVQLFSLAPRQVAGWGGIASGGFLREVTEVGLGEGKRSAKVGVR